MFRKISPRVRRARATSALLQSVLAQTQAKTKVTKTWERSCTLLNQTMTPLLKPSDKPVRCQALGVLKPQKTPTETDTRVQADYALVVDCL